MQWSRLLDGPRAHCGHDRAPVQALLKSFVSPPERSNRNQLRSTVLHKKLDYANHPCEAVRHLFPSGGAFATAQGSFAHGS